MIPSAIILHEAEVELWEAVAYYEHKAHGLGLDFEVEIERAIKSIQQAPERWPLRDDGTRRLLIDRFPFIIAYMLLADHIWIIAFAHCKRKPDIDKPSPGARNWKIARGVAVDSSASFATCKLPGRAVLGTKNCLRVLSDMEKWQVNQRFGRREDAEKPVDGNPYMRYGNTYEDHSQYQRCDDA